MTHGERITIYIDKDQLAWLDLRAKNGPNRSKQLREALTAYMMDRTAAKRTASDHIPASEWPEVLTEPREALEQEA